MNDRMYEHPATQANLALLRERGVTCSSPAAAAWRPTASGAPAACPSRPSCSPPRAPRCAPRRLERAAHAGHRRRHARADRRRPLRRQPLLRAHGLRARRRRRGARLDVVVVAANVALPRSPGIRYVDVGSAAELAPPASGSSTPPTCSSCARPSPTSARPRAPRARSTKSGALADARARADRRRPRRRSPRAGATGQTLVGFAAEHGDGALRARAREARAQAPGRDRLQRRVGARASASTPSATR